MLKAKAEGFCFSIRDLRQSAQYSVPNIQWQNIWKNNITKRRIFMQERKKRRKKILVAFSRAFCLKTHEIFYFFSSFRNSVTVDS